MSIKTQTLHTASIASKRILHSPRPPRHQLVQNVLYCSWSAKQCVEDGTTSSSTTAEANHCAVASTQTPSSGSRSRVRQFLSPLQLLHAAARGHRHNIRLSLVTLVCTSLRSKLVLKKYDATFARRATRAHSLQRLARVCHGYLHVLK